MKKNFDFVAFFLTNDLLSRRNLLSIAYSEYLVPSMIRPNFDFFLTSLYTKFLMYSINIRPSLKVLIFFEPYGSVILKYVK